MIMCIAPTGGGKTNCLMNYLARSSGEFGQIFICSFSTIDEPLYKIIKEKNHEIKLIDNIEDVPDLEEFDNKYKNIPKLFVFDDFLTLTPKQMTKIHKYLTSARKFGITVWLMAQNYTSVNKIITRNIQYYLLFKLNDNVSIDRIIRNHNISDVETSAIKKAYHLCTEKPMNFFMIDLKTSNPIERFRHNFLDFIDLRKPI